MPVLIVGASSDIGRELARLLLDEGAQVRAYVAEDDAELRAAGCKVAIGEYDDLGRLESAMEQTHTVVHLATGPEPPPGKSLEWFNEETTDVAVRAADSAGVTRFLAVSELGVDRNSRNAYLRARAGAEEIVSSAKIEHGVVRCAPMIGRDTPLGRALVAARDGRIPVTPGDGTQRLNPIGTADVARALLLADSRGARVEGTWELGGSEVVTYAELLSRATQRDRVARRRSVPGLPRVLADAYAQDRVADSSAFLAQFPMRFQTLGSVLAQLL